MAILRRDEDGWSAARTYLPDCGARSHNRSSTKPGLLGIYIIFRRDHQVHQVHQVHQDTWVAWWTYRHRMTIMTWTCINQCLITQIYMVQPCPTSYILLLGWDPPSHEPMVDRLKNCCALAPRISRWFSKPSHGPEPTLHIGADNWYESWNLATWFRRNKHTDDSYNYIYYIH